MLAYRRKLVAWTLKMAHICYDYDQEADLWGCKAHPGSYQATKCIHGNQSRKKNREHHTQQTALYIQCVIGCMAKKEMTLQCGQSALFNLHYSSIHLRQHAKLEQVVFMCQILKNLLHCTADISTALDCITVASHHFCTMISIFCTCPETIAHDRKYPTR